MSIEKDWFDSWTRIEHREKWNEFFSSTGQFADAPAEFVQPTASKSSHTLSFNRNGTLLAAEKSTPRLFVSDSAQGRETLLKTSIGKKSIWEGPASCKTNAPASRSPGEDKSRGVHG